VFWLVSRRLNIAIGTPSPPDPLPVAKSARTDHGYIMCVPAAAGE